MASITTGRIQAEFASTFPQSAEQFQRASQIFPSGGTPDGRYLEPFPVYVERASGSRKWSSEGRELIDYWVGHGSLIHGHSFGPVVEAVQKQVERGTHFGACHALEIEWAELVQRLVPSAEKLRFTSSGTEATLMALRLARLVTGRDKVLKFAGHFHGWHDWLISAAAPPHDSGEYPHPGITQSVVGELVIAPPNDLETVAGLLEEHRPACVIVEATGGRWGVAPLADGFLAGLQGLARQHDCIFILDEVISGFRVAAGGVQQLAGITPDLTSFAKILAGGLPGGCLAGRRDLLEAIAVDNALGPQIRHPCTYNASPLSSGAGIAALSAVADGEACRKATALAVQLRRGLNAIFNELDIRWIAYGEHSMIHLCPGYDGPAPNDRGELPSDVPWQAVDRSFERPLQYAMRCALLLNGIDWFGWGGMTSAAHSSEDISETLDGFRKAMLALRDDGWLNE